MNIIQDYLNKGHRVRPGTKNNTKYLVIHSTSNPTSVATGERKWLDNPENKRKASWHYVVDEKGIIQAIPDLEVAWHAGDSFYNANSIGIEMCESGNREKVLSNTLELIRFLMDKYGIRIENVIRHKDASEKDCPRILMGNNWGDWIKFKNRIVVVVDPVTTPVVEVPKWKLEGIEYLADNKLLNDKEGWSKKVNDNMPVWAAMTLLMNIHKDLKK